MVLWSKFVSKACFWFIVAFTCLNSLGSYGFIDSASVPTALQIPNVHTPTHGRVSITSLVDTQLALTASLSEFELDDLKEDETPSVIPATSISGLKELPKDLFALTEKINVFQTAWMYRHQAVIPFFILYHAWKSFLA